MLPCSGAVAAVQLLDLDVRAHCDPLSEELALEVAEVVTGHSQLVVPPNLMLELAPHLAELGQEALLR